MAVVIAGEQVLVTFEKEDRKEQVEMPAVLATVLMNNGLARKKFSELSESEKRSFIKQVKDAKALNLRLKISMKFLGGVKV